MGTESADIGATCFDGVDNDQDGKIDCCAPSCKVGKLSKHCTDVNKPSVRKTLAMNGCAVTFKCTDMDLTSCAPGSSDCYSDSTISKISIWPENRRSATSRAKDWYKTGKPCQMEDICQFPCHYKSGTVKY